MTSEQMQQLMGQAQIYQQQIQSIMTQKEILSAQLKETEKALEELEKTKETHVFKIAGPVLVKSNKSEVKKEVLEKRETIEVRIKSLENTEKKIRDKIVALREKLAPEPSAG